MNKRYDDDKRGENRRTSPPAAHVHTVLLSRDQHKALNYSRLKPQCLDQELRTAVGAAALRRT